MAEESRYFVPHTIVISSQVNVFESIVGTIEDLSSWAVNRNASLLYEPLRGTISRARRSFNQAEDETSLRNIAYLSEVARSESNVDDYIDPRIIFKLIYAILEQSRFSAESIKHLVEAEKKLAHAHHQTSFPTRVYKGQEGRNSAIKLGELRQKIYAQNQVELLHSHVPATQHIGDVHQRASELVHYLKLDAERQQVSGIELNLLEVMTVLKDEPELLKATVSQLISENLSNSGNALVQVVTIQPNRIDKLENKPLVEMEELLWNISYGQFEGMIMYAPGSGDLEEEINTIRIIFPYLTRPRGNN